MLYKLYAKILLKLYCKKRGKNYKINDLYLCFTISKDSKVEISSNLLSTREPRLKNFLTDIVCACE